MTSTGLDMCLRCGFIGMGEEDIILILNFDPGHFCIILLVLETVKTQIKLPGSPDIPAHMTSVLKSSLLFVLSVLLSDIP